ncbi:interleukin-22 [Erythrolamprus reginae]|uniref:interleukin-22 n=1 Tax=Erythrolamprus reginae TaxID=121349 RepID=UPI00396CC392
MDPWKNWTRCYLLWVFCCYHYLFLFTVGNPLPLSQTSKLTCSLNPNHFTRFAFKDIIFTVARQASAQDLDTVNRFVGQDLFINVTKNEGCYIMKRVTDFFTHTLHRVNNTNPNFLEGIYFFAELSRELGDCKSPEDTTYIEINLKRMENKLKQLGDNGINKMIGELDLLYDYLKDECTSRNTTGTRRKGSRKNEGSYPFRILQKKQYML